MTTAGDVENWRQAGETETSSGGTHTPRTKEAPLGMFRSIAVYIYFYLFQFINTFYFRTGVFVKFRANQWWRTVLRNFHRRPLQKNIENLVRLSPVLYAVLCFLRKKVTKICKLYLFFFQESGSPKSPEPPKSVPPQHCPYQCRQKPCAVHCLQSYHMNTLVF